MTTDAGQRLIEDLRKFAGDSEFANEVAMREAADELARLLIYNMTLVLNAPAAPVKPVAGEA